MKACVHALLYGHVISSEGDRVFAVGVTFVKEKWTTFICYCYFSIVFYGKGVKIKRKQKWVVNCLITSEWKEISPLGIFFFRHFFFYTSAGQFGVIFSLNNNRAILDLTQECREYITILTTWKSFLLVRSADNGLGNKSWTLSPKQQNCFTSPCDWLAKFAQLFQPMRGKT